MEPAVVKEAGYLEQPRLVLFYWKPAALSMEIAG
jgi:hypothetical protein